MCMKARKRTLWSNFKHRSSDWREKTQTFWQRWKTRWSSTSSRWAAGVDTQRCLLASFGTVVLTRAVSLLQSDKLQEQQDLIEELQCHLSTPTLLGLGLNLRSRPHTAPMGSLQHGQNGGCSRQVRIQRSSASVRLLRQRGFPVLLLIQPELLDVLVPARYV